MSNDGRPPPHKNLAATKLSVGVERGVEPRDSAPMTVAMPKGWNPADSVLPATKLSAGVTPGAPVTEPRAQPSPVVISNPPPPHQPMHPLFTGPPPPMPMAQAPSKTTLVIGIMIGVAITLLALIGAGIAYMAHERQREVTAPAPIPSPEPTRYIPPPSGPAPPLPTTVESSATVNCNPPFTIDADGIKRWKRGCLDVERSR